MRLLTDLPLSTIQHWARGQDGGVAAGRIALARSVADVFDPTSNQGASKRRAALLEVA